jgi:hypothetical protein
MILKGVFLARNRINDTATIKRTATTPTPVANAKPATQRRKLHQQRKAAQAIAADIWLGR